MELRGIPLADFTAVTTKVSTEFYGGNLIVHQDSYEYGVRKISSRARLAVLDSTGPGARRSWQGRRMPVACWHTYRDVLLRLFDRYPDSIVITKMARYNGREGFQEEYPLTGLVNIGSEMHRVCAPDLCECVGSSRNWMQREASPRPVIETPKYMPGRAPDSTVFGPVDGMTSDYGDAHVVSYNGITR